VESTYTETLSGLLDRTPESVQIPPELESLAHSRDGTAITPSDLRRFARRKMLGEMFCQISGALPAFPRTSGDSKVISLDLSRGGIRFLTDKQMYPEEELLLWTLIGRIPCKVARCRKHNDACYEVGVEISK
jgi:hypothetical protein